MTGLVECKLEAEVEFGGEPIPLDSFVTRSREIVAEAIVKEIPDIDARLLKALISEISISYEYGYDDYAETYLHYSRPESQKEIAARIKREETRAKKAAQRALERSNKKLADEAKERALLERLKKKYE
jgi:hypothetical protein